MNKLIALTYIVFIGGIIGSGFIIHEAMAEVVQNYTNMAEGAK